MTKFNRILLTTIALSIMFSFSIFTLFMAVSSEHSVKAILIDYDENFYSVTYSTYDSDSDGYVDSITLEMDVDTWLYIDTPGEYVDVTVEGELDDPDVYLVDSNYTTWLIYGDETEYGYLDLTATAGGPGYYDYYIDLYDDLANLEDSWFGSVYLYPIGYGVVSDYYESFYSVVYSPYDSDSDGYDDSVTLTVDADTTGSYSYVTIYGDLIDPDIYLVDANDTTWLIYGDDTEYGYLDLTATSGAPGYYEYDIYLYDDLANLEDSWSGSVYLYPIGYGITPTLLPTLIPTPPPTPSVSPTPEPTLTPTPSPDGGN